MARFDDDFDDDELDDFMAEESFDVKPTAGMKVGSRVRHVNPLGMRVLVKVRSEENKSGGGLYLPEGAKESSLESVIAEVLEVASAIDDETDEAANISGIPLGALVLIEKECGIKTPWDDTVRIVETGDVLAIITEIELS